MPGDITAGGGTIGADDTPFVQAVPFWWRARRLRRTRSRVGAWDVGCGGRRGARAQRVPLARSLYVPAYSWPDSFWIVSMISSVMARRALAGGRSR